MKNNLTLTAAQVERAREPGIGLEYLVYISTDLPVKLGSLRALTASTAEYTSAGGLGIPSTFRDLMIRASGPLTGVGGNMTIRFNVVLEGDVADTADATFHVPTYTAHGGNHFPIGICADLVPTTLANAALKVKTLGSFVSVANMSPGNSFEVWTTPPTDSFTFIDCTRNKGGKFNLPGIVEIACGSNPAAYTKLGRGESNMLSISVADRGALEQVQRFNGHKVFVKFDTVKGETVLMQRTSYSGYYVRAMSEIPDGNEEVIASSEGPYEMFSIGYARVA